MVPRVLILGATGGTGQQVLLQALARGYDVTALVRSPDRFPPGAERLRVLVGDARDATVVAGAVQGQDAVVSVLGGGKSLKSGGLIAATAPVIVQAMEQANVRRIVFTSAFGVGPSLRDMPLIPRIMMAVFLREVYADKLAGEDVIRRSALDWTIVYPAMLKDGPKTGRYRVGEHLKLRGFPTIARADVAEFLVAQVEDRTLVKKGVFVSP